MPRIHPTALVDPTARLAEGVEVGPWCIVGPGCTIGGGTILESHVNVSGEVALGERNRIRHHASIEGWTTLGDDNEVWPYAYLGQKTQDKKFAGGRPGTRIGSRNVFREYVTVHAATGDGDRTTIGDDNLLLAFVHVAHDCQLGSGIIISNSTGISGHVVIEDRAVIGGMVGIIQHCRIGRLAMVGGVAKVVQDIPPYMLADGSPAETRMPNKIGLQRAGWTEEEQSLARAAHRIVYREGLNRGQALERLRELPEAGHPVIAHFIRFLETSTKGVA